MRKLSAIIITAALICFSFSGKEQQLTPAKLLGHMYDSIRAIKTLRTKIYALERVENKFLTANSEIKLQVAPRRLYFINPKKKLEILYNHGQLNNKALVKPHVFPYLTLTLDPTGNIMRKNQHYTINELGFEFIGKSVALTLAKDKEGIKNMIYHGRASINSFRCHFIEYENKNFGYVDYVVGEKETASSIAYKLCVNDYLLRYKNDLVNDFGYLKKGRVLKVTNLYCKKAMLYLDERTFMPVAISLYDDTGLFERYEFTDIQINKPVKEEEFTRDYRDYHF